MNLLPAPRLLRILLAAMALLAAPVWSQSLVVGRFTSSVLDSGWTLDGAAALTAPALDADGAGWLRLTGNTLQARGTARQAVGSFSAADGLTVSFSYAIWGGGNPGADGLAVYLYDASQSMAGAVPGGGLGFCKGAGAWLALALDEFGNFSHPGDGCAGGGGPGNRPQSLVVRGPTAAGNPFIGQISLPVPLDAPEASARPAAGDVSLQLLPRSTGGFSLVIDWRPNPSVPWRRLVDQADFLHAAPAALRLGVTASTGAARNIHEIRDLRLVTLLPVTVSQRFDPPAIAAGGTSTLTLTLGNARGLATTLAQPFTLTLPPGLLVARAPELGGTCAGGLAAVGGGNTLTVERGALLRAGGCTITVNVTGAAAGAVASVIPVGRIVTNAGTNVSPASATLTVR